MPKLKHLLVVQLSQLLEVALPGDLDTPSVPTGQTDQALDVDVVSVEPSAITSRPGVLKLLNDQRR